MVNVLLLLQLQHQFHQVKEISRYSSYEIKKIVYNKKKNFVILYRFHCCSGSAAAAAMQLQLQQDTQGDVYNCSNNNKGTLGYLIYDNL